MLLIPNALCCSVYKHNCVCAVTEFLPAKYFCQLLRVKRTIMCRHVQAQLHFPDDQQRTFEISNISYCNIVYLSLAKYRIDFHLFSRYDFDSLLTRRTIFCNFSFEWLTVRTQSNSKFMFEVISILSHQMNQSFLASGS